MTPRQRLLVTLRGGISDRVPVSPDTSNMIPAKLTGKPFWDLYLYQDPPQWLAYIRCAKKFGIDALMDGYARVLFDELDEIDHESVAAIVEQSEERIVTQSYRKVNGKYFWNKGVSVYPRDNSPVHGMKPEKLGLDATPTTWREVEGIRQWPQGEEMLKFAKQELGEQGLVGVSCGTSLLIGNSEEEIYRYYDDPQAFVDLRDEMLERFERRFMRLMAMSCRPDFICTGASGSLVYQTPAMFRQLGLPIVQRMSALAKQYGLPSHVHSCGPETALVKMVAEETDLTVIDPLEIPPMGDCDLAALKAQYGDRLVLKGNLHTTEVMLYGSVRDVRRAALEAIRDAGVGGRFILSTGDQCGRDTPEANLYAMLEAAEEFGHYPLDIPRIEAEIERLSR